MSTTQDIIIYAALIAFSVLCVFAFLTWLISLVCICTQKNVKLPKVANKERNVEVYTGAALTESNGNCVDVVDERPSLFTPSTSYEGYLSIHTAWSQGRSSVDN